MRMIWLASLFCTGCSLGGTPTETPTPVTGATGATGDTATSGTDCVGTLSGGVGVGQAVTCDEKRPCSGTAYIGVYNENPLAGPDVAPIGLAVLPDLDLAAESPVKFEIPDLGCGPNVIIPFLDIDDNAGDPPRPSLGDLYRNPQAGRMGPDGVELILVLDSRWRPN